MKISKLLVLILFLLTTNTCAINISLFSYLFKKQESPTKIFFNNIKSATTTLISDTLDKSKNIIYSIIGPKKGDVIDATLKISAVAALAAATTYAIIKIAKSKKNKEKELAKNNALINSIIENFDFNAPGKVFEQNRSLVFGDKKKWALWPSDIPFLALLQIPQEVLFQKLMQDIKIFYKANNTQNNSQENMSETKYLLDLFTKDIDIEIADYQRKYNIILISNNFEKKQECLVKIKDNIKKLIYLKSTATHWVNK